MSKTITKVWNKDHTISLKHRGRVVFRTRNTIVLATEQINSYLTGWFGTDDKTKWKLGKTQFRA